MRHFEPLGVQKEVEAQLPTKSDSEGAKLSSKPVIHVERYKLGISGHAIIEMSYRYVYDFHTCLPVERCFDFLAVCVMPF